MPITSVFTAGAQLDQLPQTSYANFRNLLDGGDFSTNPMQRNVGGLASNNALATPGNNAVTYFADRWFGYANGNSAIAMSLVGSNAVPGFNYTLAFGRNNTNNNTAALYFGQTLESADSYKVQGQPVTFSFWAALGNNFTGANNQVTVQVITGTGVNQPANNMCLNNWSNSSYVVNQNQTLTSTLTRYSYTGLVSSAATQIGVALSYTPAAGNAGAADNFQVNGLQLEVGTVASPFEHRSIEIETAKCQRYAWVLAEPAAGAICGSGGAGAAANNQIFYIPTPVQMRAAPTVTVSAGNFLLTPSGGATGVGNNFAAGSNHTPNAINLVAKVAQAAGGASVLEGNAGSGYVVASADF